MNSQELEELLDQLTETRNPDLAHQLMKELQNSIVILPAVMPPDSDPELLRQMEDMAVKGEERPLPDHANPNPCILEDQKGNKVLPVFTSEKHLNSNDTMKHFPVRLNIPYGQCVQLLGQTDDVRSIVVNPFTHNFQADFQIDQSQDHPDSGQLQNGQKITAAQFHALVRQHVEADLMPKRLFEEQGDFIQEISTGGSCYLLELYQPPYTQHDQCPYTEEDFDVLSLMIRDDLQIVQLTLPRKHLYTGTCTKVYLIWNPVKAEAAYYAIVLQKDRHLMLHQAFADGTNRKVSEAPEEGSELQKMIDLYSGKGI